LRMGLIGISEKSVANHLTPRNNPEDGRIHRAKPSSVSTPPLQIHDAQS
jgi:hypothetical protein